MDLSKNISKKTGLPKTAVFRLDGTATVKTYALRIAENLMHSKYEKPSRLLKMKSKQIQQKAFRP